MGTGAKKKQPTTPGWVLPADSVNDLNRVLDRHATGSMSDRQVCGWLQRWHATVLLSQDELRRELSRR